MGKLFVKGLKAGIPIGLGYLSVSFTFGIMATSYGLYWWQSVLISMLTVTSAGQLAGIGIMVHPGQYIEMLISQLTINMRYSFMAVSLSQKTDAIFKGIWRFIFGFMITDEIFAVAYQEGEEQGVVKRSFFAGLCVIPYIGWALGTLLGAVLGNVLPDRILNALLIGIYGMFVAIVVPEIKKSRPITFVVILSAALSCAFHYLPVLKQVSTGITITVCSIISAVVAALLFPIPSEDGKEAEHES